MFVAAVLASALIAGSAPADASGPLSAATIAGTASMTSALSEPAGEYQAVDWGQNLYGQLGDNSFTQSDVPVQVSGGHFVTSLAGGNHHSVALLSDGTVAAWGQNAFGQLGDPEAGTSDVPVPVEGLAGVGAIAAGENYSLALLSSGTVMAWGEDEQGQLGDGKTTELSESPVAVKSLSGVTAIAAGGNHSLALLSNGTVMAWGENEHGELGDGKTAKSNVPVAVRSLSGVTAIAAGGDFSLALLSDGTVMAWGSDEYGQLGNSSVEEDGGEGERGSDVPVPVSGLTGVSAVAAGTHHSLALLSGGEAMAWGQDTYGELGDGALVRSDEVPTAVSGLSGVTAVAAGGHHSLALLSDGAVTSWGEDRYGQLGDGSEGEPSDVPVAVSGLGEVRGIAAGISHDLAYSEPFPSVTGLSPRAGAPAGGAQVTISGSGFEGASAVSFGANAASFTVESPTSIAAISPAGAIGAVNVTVTTPAGTSAVVAADRFSYVPPPAIKKLSVKRGAGGGGTAVTITGSGFEGATSVSFGASAAESFTVDASTSIAAVSPPGAGTVDVTVTALGGVSAISKHDRFEFLPAVEAVTPDAGPAAGGTSVTIAGAGFAQGAGATAFKFGSKQATGVECASSTKCTATTPANKAKAVQVKATVGKAKSPANPPEDEFTYE